MLTRSASVLVVCAMASVAAPLSLPEILARLDQNAATFRTMSAKLERLDYTAVIKDASKESGTILMLKKNKDTVVMRIDFTHPDIKQVSYADKKVQIYLPKINTVQIVDVGKIDNLISQGVMIGFGSTAKELQKSYTIKVAGEETIHDKLTTKLELIPKANSPMTKLKKIEVWLANSDAYPIRQKLYQGAGDYNQATYSELRINPPLTEQDLKLKLPKNVKKENPAK